MTMATLRMVTGAQQIANQLKMAGNAPLSGNRALSAVMAKFKLGKPAMMGTLLQEMGVPRLVRLKALMGGCAQ